MTLQSVLFDFDGTLADSSKCAILATQKAFIAMDLTPPTDEKIEYYMGIPIEQSFKEMTEQSLEEKTYNQLLLSFRQFYMELEKDCLRTFPGIKSLLEKLWDNGVQLFVVSSKKTDVLMRNLETLGLTSYIMEGIGSDKVKAYKPDPAGVNYIIRKYNLIQLKTLVVGDAIFDIQMGKRAGTLTAAVSWGSHSIDALEKESPDRLFTQVEEIATYVLE